MRPCDTVRRGCSGEGVTFWSDADALVVLISCCIRLSVIGTSDLQLEHPVMRIIALCVQCMRVCRRALEQTNNSSLLAARSQTHETPAKP